MITINMPISTEGSGTPTTRPKTGSQGRRSLKWGGGGELLTCPYPLKNPVPTSPLADGISTAPSGPVGTLIMTLTLST